MADVVLMLHLGFVLFAVAGGVVVYRWPVVAWLHVPAAAWAFLVEIFGWTCPLTPLEDRLRGIPEGDDFIARTILHVLYPSGLTRSVQMILGMSVLALNLVVYGAVLSSCHKSDVRRLCKLLIAAVRPLLR